MNTEFVRHTKNLNRVYGIPVMMVFYLIAFFLISEIVNFTLESMEYKHWIMNWYFPVIAISLCLFSKNLDDKYFIMKNIENLALKHLGRRTSIKAPKL